MKFINNYHVIPSSIKVVLRYFNSEDQQYGWEVYLYETKTPRVQKKGEAKKNQRLKSLISNKAKKSVNESVT